MRKILLLFIFISIHFTQAQTDNKEISLKVENKTKPEILEALEQKIVKDGSIRHHTTREPSLL